MSTSGLHHAATADWPEVAELLMASGLPPAGAEEHLADFMLERRDGVLLGCAGLERYGRYGLLRSVAVASSARRTGVGQELVRQLLARADEDGLEAVALLTTTAAEYFPRFGFQIVDRTEIPAPVQQSVEFREACPSSAIAMVRTKQRAHANPAR